MWSKQSPITSVATASPADSSRRAGRPLRGLLLALLAVAPLLAAQAAAPPHQSRKAPVQCWKDDRGQRVCGDVVPPSEARRQRALVDRNGVTRKLLPAQKSAEEAATEMKAQQQREQALAYDRYLLQAYPTVTDIERTRDERIASLDGRLQLAEKAVVDSEATLKDLNARHPEVGEDGADLNPKLRAKIREFTAARDENAEAMKRIRGERDKLSADFARDLLRYRELRPTASR